MFLIDTFLQYFEWVQGEWGAGGSGGAGVVTVSWFSMAPGE